MTPLPQNPPESADTRDPIRVAFCITDLDPGGAERALAQILFRLDRRAFAPRVYCLGPQGIVAEWLRQHAIPVDCAGARRWSALRATRWLTRELAAWQPEILQCFLFHANLIGRFAGKRAGVPVIVSGHRVAEREKQWHLWLDRWTRQRVDHHVCVSQGVAEHLRRSLRLNADEFTVIPNGVEIHPGAPAELKTFGLPPQARVILAAGRLHRQKGFDILLEAFRKVASRCPEPILMIVGDGPRRSALQRQAEKLDIAQRVIWPGRREDLPQLMRAADVFVLSSRWEGMPNVLLEAMACGLPVVSTRVEGVEELIRDGETGLLAEPDNAADLALQIEAMIKDREFAGRCATAARDRVSREFTWESAARHYEDLYRALLNRNRGSG